MTAKRSARIRHSVTVFCLLFFAFCVLPSTYAQSSSATLSGTVEDQNGAVVPGATVTAENKATGLKRQATTNGEGYFTIPLLPPSTYSVTAQAGGFSPVQVSNVVLNVGDQKALQIQLKAGDINATVQVVNDAPLISESPAVGTVVDRNFAENIPMNGRSFQTLIQLTPGVVATSSNSGDSGQFSVNGQRAVSNYWTVDGVSANVGIAANFNAGAGFGGSLGGFSVLGGTNSLVSIDALQEFRIQTSTFAPEFGRTPGGQISIVTRSGANRFHGTIFDYLRNDVFDANDWFANTKGLARPKERQNDFGGTFSGPIRRDRTFFFFSYEGLRLRLPQTKLTTVPDLNARQNAVAAMQPFLNAYPLPNGPDNTATGVAQLNATYSDPASLDASSIRIDHKLSEKVTLFGRFNYSPSELVQRATSTLNALSDLQSSRIKTQTLTVGTTWAVNASIVNDFRFNYSKTNSSANLFLDNFGGAVPLSSLPLPSPFSNKDSVFIFTVFGLANGGLQAGNGTRNVQRQLNLTEVLSLQRGAHAFKFGADYRRLSPSVAHAVYGQQPSFLNVSAAQTGSLFFRVLQSNKAAQFRFQNLGVFAQDSWRVSSNLTLTYGLRWDVDFVPRSINGPSLPAITGYSLTNLSGLALAPDGTPPFQTRYSNFAPRVGFSYKVSKSPDRGLVIRGGFGVFYDLATSQVGSAINNSYPFGATNLTPGGTFPLDSVSAAPPPITVAQLSSSGALLTAFDPQLRLPYTLQWNVALERELGRQQTITASYVGAAGRRLLQTALINSPNSSFNQVAVTGNTATSNYNALQVQFQRRPSHGLQVLASYTWSHSIDTASGGSTVFKNNAFVPGSDPNSNRGPSAFDIRHVFSAAATYDIPAPKINKAAKAILGNWSIENLFTARSATPVNIFYQAFSNLVGANTEVRPDVVSGQPLYLFGSQYPGGKAFNSAAFTAPPRNSSGQPTRQGNLGRNALRGFGIFQWDFAMHRDFAITESVRLQFRAEMFNALNHPNFGNPSGNLLSPTSISPQFGLSSQMFGQSLAGPGGLGAGAFSPLYQLGGPRSIQFALKLSF